MGATDGSADTLTRRIAALSPAQRALLARELESRRARGSARIPRKTDGTLLPLSFGQERLWFLNQLDPAGVAYHMATAVRLRGDLNRDALMQACRELVARHESLRTRFVTVNGDLVQQVDPAPPTAPRVLNLTGLRGKAQEDAVAEELHREHRTPFDLGQGPLLRMALLELGPAEHILTWTLHHIISDGWSMAVFKRELSALYDAFRAGRPSPFAPLPIQYGDYAAWQRQRLQGEMLDRLLAYWTRKLEGAPPLLALPTDGPRLPDDSHAGESRALELPRDVAASLVALCRREGVTPFVGLLSAFKVVLARWSGQADIVVGTPVAGRDRVELEGLIGFFINTVVVRTDLSGSPTFRELLARVRETALDAFEHQDLPFEKLIDELHVERSRSHTPVFQVFFNLLNMETARESFSGLDVERVGRPTVEAKFDLTLYAMETNGTIRLRAIYRSDLFRGDTIERMLEQLQLLLEQAASDPAASIHSYSLILSRDRAVVPDPVAPLHREAQASIWDGFAAQVARRPNRTAVVDAEGAWTYADLAAASTRLASYLRSGGLRNGDVVAIHASPSAALVWCMLGILRAGGTFLILDSAYPAARLRRYLERARPAALLHLRSAGTLPEEIEDFAARGAVRVRLDIPEGNARDLADCLPAWDATGPDSAVTGDSAAYVVFTSGSTGEALAVTGAHAPVSHFLGWHIRTFGLRDEDRFSLLSGLAHDPLLRDVFTPLWLGASLHVPPAGVRETPGAMLRWMRGEGITVCHATPALTTLLDDPGGASGTLDSLKWLFLGGDRLTRGTVRRVRQSAPYCRLVNFYGATETPQAMAFHRADAAALAPDDPAGDVPLGQGIDDAQLLLLNEAGRQAGVGELAEICVRTPYLSRGYLNEPRLTLERFLVNPFTSDASDRIYRTGDLGRYLPDGSVAFEGRRDQQLKLRGFRIEPAEVEAVLRESPAVRDAAVVAHEDAAGERRLVAYVVWAGGAPADIDALRAFLRARLPDYLCPAAYVALEGLPLTPNGKIDRHALPAPAQADDAARAAYVAPRDALEEVIADVWREVLPGAPSVGAHDDFFALGGHSLLAVKMVDRLRARTGLKMPVGALFEAPTPAALARRLSTGPDSSDSSSLDGILGRQREWVRQWKGTRHTPESLIVTLNESGARQRLFWCLQAYSELTALAKYLGRDRPVHGMRSGHLVMKYKEESVRALASCYAAEMVAMQPEGPFVLGGNCQGSRIAHGIAERLREMGRTVSLLILMEQRLFRRYDGPVALIFGRDSHFNPYTPGADPKAEFHRAYPAGFTVDIIKGAHGKFFEPPNIQSLAAALEMRLAAISTVSPSTRLFSQSRIASRINRWLARR